MTQVFLAARLAAGGVRIDRAGVAKIEGQLRQVSDVELVALADALGVTTSFLLGDHE